MRRAVTYSLEREDGGALDPRRIEQVHTLLQGYVSAAEADPKEPHPGIKAYRRIRGNVFTEDHVRTFHAFAHGLTGRMQAAGTELSHEKSAVAAGDEWSERAYDGVGSMMAEGHTLAIRYADEFLEEFIAEAGSEKVHKP